LVCLIPFFLHSRILQSEKRRIFVHIINFFLKVVYGKSNRVAGCKCASTILLYLEAPKAIQLSIRAIIEVMRFWIVETRTAAQLHSNTACSKEMDTIYKSNLLHHMAILKLVRNEGIEKLLFYVFKNAPELVSQIDKTEMSPLMVAVKQKNEVFIHYCLELCPFLPSLSKSDWQQLLGLLDPIKDQKVLRDIEIQQNAKKLTPIIDGLSEYNKCLPTKLEKVLNYWYRLSLLGTISQRGLSLIGNYVTFIELGDHFVIKELRRRQKQNRA